MGDLVKFLSVTKILEEVESPINGKIQVIKSLAFGTYIQVDGLTQSGGVVRDVWRTTLQKLQKSKTPKIQKVLILGLGGGSAAKLVRKYWPKAKITGVELDPVMIDIGNRHLGLGNSHVEVVIEDAYEFLSQRSEVRGQRFDLILNDIYVGHEVPKKFESDNFIGLVKSALANSGIAVFNRLYHGEKRAQAAKFAQKLEKHFAKVDAVYPEANVMYICTK